MKSLLLLIALICGPLLRAEDVVLGDTQALHQKERYVWVISSDRIAKLPVWKKEQSFPLSPQRAEEIAYAWTREQPLAGFIPDRPYVISLVQFPAPFSDRYFYKVDFAGSDRRDSFWTVHILMDGSVVEPTKREPIKITTDNDRATPRRV